MATTPRKQDIFGYNVQAAVEANNHLIVAHKVTKLRFDHDALSMINIAACDAMTTDQFTEVADKGYFKDEEIVASVEANFAYDPEKGCLDLPG